MITGRLQRGIDRLRATSTQRWLLAGAAVLAPTLATFGMAVVSDAADTWVIALVLALATAVAIQPDSHLAVAVVTVVVIEWLSLGNDVTSPWSIAVGTVLFVFHAVVALIAVTPHTADIDRAVLRCWLGRGAAVAATTVGVWLLVVGLDARDAAGNAALSVAAFGALAGLVIALRVLVLSRQSD